MAAGAVAKRQNLIFGSQGVWVVFVGRGVCFRLRAPRAQASSSTTGRRHNNLSGAAEGPSKRLTFLTASDGAQSVELFTQVLPGKVEFSFFFLAGESDPLMTSSCFIPAREYRCDASALWYL